MPAHPPPPVKIQFLDSATGAAIRPALFSVRPVSRPDVHVDYHSRDIASNGRAEFYLPPGRHMLTTSAPGYETVTGELELHPSHQHRVRFLLDPTEEPEETRPDNVARLRRPGFMLIQGFAVDDESGEPLANAQVSATPGNHRTSTDTRGFFRFYVPAPIQADSDEVGSTLLVEQHGYKSHLRHSLELWSEGDCTYRLRLNRGGGLDVMDERTTRRRAPARPGSATPSTTEPPPAAQVDPPVPEPATLPENATVRVPRNIRVLNSDNITVDYVSLTYYTRAVLGSEWIASWGSIVGGTNSLNAGAVAVRCYAIYKLNAAGPTSNYDICGTTSCQVYNPTKIHSLTDAAVNYTLNWVLLSGTSIANTEYSAENNSLDLEGVTSFSCADGFTAPTGGYLYDPICAGQDRFGHGRGMCQWGTARWATGRKMNGRASGDTTPSGYPRRDWKWIVQHYYPTLTFAKGAPLVPGDDVRAMRTLEARACPGGTITNGITCALVATLPANATGVILEGPTPITADGKGFSWYKIQWNDASSTVGWAVENYLERVYSVPAIPINLTAFADSANQIRLNWTDTSDVEAGFVLERAPAAAGPFVGISVLGANVTAFLDKNLLPGNTWHYRLSAYNSGGRSSYSMTAGATTPQSPPVLTPIQSQTVPEESLLQLNASVTAPQHIVELARFDHFTSETANGVVLFREPRLSGSTAGLLDRIPNLSAVTDVFPASGTTGNVLRIQCSFTNLPDPWLRLTTVGASALANPVVDLTRKLQFRVHTDRTIRLGLGIRETVTPAGTAIGSNGGQTGAIEWVGVTNLAGTAPVPGKIIPAGSWSLVSFDMPNEPVRNFTGGNGVLSTASGLGVLEHLAVVPLGGSGAYTIYLDDFAQASERDLAWSLAPGAPSGATIHPDTGLVNWTPTEAQGPGTFQVSVVVSDDSIPPLKATNSFTVQVSEVNRTPSLTVPTNHLTFHAGTTVVFTNSASDSDFPLNTLFFSLDPAFPPGAQIHPESGVFTWPTVESTAHTTNQVTIRVTDNGSPPATVSTPVTIVVRPLPTPRIDFVSSAELTLTWDAIPGTIYTVEFKNDLAHPTWSKLQEISGDTPVLTIKDTPTTAQRFYRIR